MPIEFETLAIEIPHAPAEILKQDAFDAPPRGPAESPPYTGAASH